MRAKDIMITKVQACTMNDRAADAIQIMGKYNCGFVPIILDHNSWVLEGVVTDRDLVLYLGKQDKRPSEVTLEECFTRSPISIRKDASLLEIAWLMEENQIHRIPVVDENHKLLGVISVKDLAEEASKERGASHREITEREIGEIIESIAITR